MINLPADVSDINCFDNTRISEYKTCPRKFFLRHELGWAPYGTASPLVFGGAWHAAMDVVWEMGKKFKPADLAELAHAAYLEHWEAAGFDPAPDMDLAAQMAPRTPQIAYEMLYEYTDQRRQMIQGSELIAVEQPFAVPIPGVSNTWYVGKLDKVIDYNAARLVIEHKTTTAYATVGNFRSDFVDQWFMSAQVKGYQFGGGLFYGDINSVWVDAALVHRKVHNAFKLIPISHNFVLLEEWLGGTKQWIQEIIQERKAFKVAGELLPGMFKRNDESCFGKYGPCPYIDICRTISDPSTLDEPPVGFEHRPWEPFSILGLQKLIQENKTGDDDASSTIGSNI